MAGFETDSTWIRFLSENNPSIDGPGGILIIPTECDPEDLPTDGGRVASAPRQALMAEGFSQWDLGYRASFEDGLEQRPEDGEDLCRFRKRGRVNAHGAVIILELGSH